MKFSCFVFPRHHAKPQTFSNKTHLLARNAEINFLADLAFCFLAIVAVVQ
jgi:hypothetical protein